MTKILKERKMFSKKISLIYGKTKTIEVAIKPKGKLWVNWSCFRGGKLISKIK